MNHNTMYKLSKKFLTTYDPNYLEQHTDSSDFEDSSPVSTPRHDYHRLRTKVHNTRSKQEKDILNQQISDRQMYSRVYCQSSRELWQTKAVVSRDTTELDYQVRQRCQDVKTLIDRADQIDVSQQRAVTRHKLIPCLSNMFRRPSNNVKQMSIIKENQAQNVQTNNGTRCHECTCKMRKLNRRQPCQTEQPVYAVRGIYGAPIPFRQTHITQSPLPNVKSYKHRYYDEYDFADSEQEMESRKKRKKWKKAELEKKQRSKKQKNGVQQCPSKQAWKSPYPFFTTPYQYHTTDVGCSARYPESPRENIMASTSSGFWEYLLERFNKKSQANKTEICQACGRSEPAGITSHNDPAPTTRTEATNQCRGCPDYCGYVPNVEPESHYRQETSNDSCNCSHNALQPPKPVKPPKPETPPKVQCMCSKKKDKPPSSKQPPPKPPSEPPPCSVCRKCQQPHDEIVQAVAEKYNGEVLCIHNPPCILINGCLNLPAPKEEKQIDVWPMTEDRISFHGQSSQYPPPCYDVHQCQIPEYRHEKIVQSLCSHKPPCEVVRTCVKPKYDPTLHNPCIHVPTCEKIPECMMDRKLDRSKCPHKPKCLDMPVCTRNYIMLTATEEVGIQARPGDLRCRHEPPCVLIPKCFARVLYDSCIPYDSIPDCAHRPMCEMIPACCRKSTKEMITSSCQGSMTGKPVHYQSKLLRIMRRSRVK